MKLLKTTVLAVLAQVCSAKLPAGNTTTQGKRSPSVVPNSFIIHLEPGTEPTAQLSSHGVSYSVRHQFNSKYFNGVSVTLNDGATAASLNSIPGVVGVWPVSMVERPAPVAMLPVYANNGGTNISHITGPSDVNSALKMGNVDKLHNMGIKGKGVRVSLIDSGVDYRHPALGGGFGPGYKIAVGYDLVGDDYTGSNNPKPGPDPLTTCASGGHGTHTTGIVGMQDPKGEGFGLIGVAPEATLGMYRVFGCEGGATNDVVMAGMTMAAQDGADIISMSLGIDVYWDALSPFGPLVQSLYEQGVAVIAAAGNDGDLGPYAVSAPASSVYAVSVTSVENDLYTTVYKAEANHGSQLEYISVLPWTQKESYEVLRIGTWGGSRKPSSNDYNFFYGGCDAGPWEALAQHIKDPDRTIVALMYASNCDDGVWAGYAATYNITNIIIYIDDDQENQFLFEPGSTDGFNILELDYPNSQQLVDMCNAQNKTGGNYTLTFGDSTVYDAPDPAGGFVNSFATMGPPIEMQLKPQIATPGGNILSTFPLEVNGYAVLSGTSMATPYAAGCYALLKSQFPSMSQTDLVALLQSTSAPIKVQDGSDGMLSSVAQQGSGMINALAAYQADTTFSPSQLTLNDSATPVPQKITIKNTSKNTQTYTVSHSGASYIRVITDLNSGNGYYLETFTLVNNAMYADASFSQSTFSIIGGDSIDLEVHLTPPSDPLPQLTLPLYSGFVHIESSSGSEKKSYSIPYLGVPYNRDEGNLFEHNNQKSEQYIGYNNPGLYDGNNFTQVESIHHFILQYPDGDNPPVPPNFDPPIVTFWYTQPSSYIRMELVPINTTFVPTYYGYNRSVVIDPAANPPSNKLHKAFLGVESYFLYVQWCNGQQPKGTTYNDASSSLWPYPYMAQFVEGFDVQNPLDNGELVNVTSGDYRMLVRGAKYGADLLDPDSYISWLSPVLRVTVPPVPSNVTQG